MTSPCDGASQQQQRRHQHLESDDDELHYSYTRAPSIPRDDTVGDVIGCHSSSGLMSAREDADVLVQFHRENIDDDTLNTGASRMDVEASSHYQTEPVSALDNSDARRVQHDHYHDHDDDDDDAAMATSSSRQRSASFSSSETLTSSNVYRSYMRLRSKTSRCVSEFLFH